MPDMKALEKLAKGRAIAVRKAPYFTTMIYSLVPIEAPGCGTLFVTPQLVMGYDPDYVKGLSDEEIAGCLAHEANHPIRQSHTRLPGGDPYLKNLAADIPINEDLHTAGFTLPQGVVYAGTYGLQPGKTMEEYYEVLEKLQADGKLPPRPPGMGAGQCGGVAGNSPNPQLEEELDQQHGRSPADVKSKQKQAAEDIKQHQQKGRGSFGSDMTEAIDALDGPAKVPWHRELSHILKNAMTQMAQGATDYSMSRPSNRTFSRNDGIIRPGLVAYKPEVMVCLDTSGSMGAEQLGSSFRELVGVIRALPHVSHVQFMEADADVACRPRRVAVRDLHSMEIHGRGGTDFRPAIEYAQKMKPKPDVLIYFTDGDGYAPAQEPKGLRVIWCVVPSYYRRAPAPWGKVIFVDSDDPSQNESEIADPLVDDEDDTL